jgi:hypothetical protein
MDGIDRIDSFYQEMDSKSLLDKHGPGLTKEAREVLRTAPPHARVGGMIIMPDSKEGESFRAAIAKATGKPAPVGELVGVIPRQMIESVLRSRPEPWMEEPGEQQSVLPVMVATRNGLRIGYFPLIEDDASDAPPQAHSQ